MRLPPRSAVLSSEPRTRHLGMNLGLFHRSISSSTKIGGVVVVFFQSTTKREMPYADPERQREAVKVWQQAHPEKLKAYRKTMFMKNSIAKHRFPKQRSIQFHGLTDAEVIHLVENVLASLRASSEDELGRAGDELGRAEDELGRAGDE